MECIVPVAGAYVVVSGIDTPSFSRTIVPFVTLKNCSEDTKGVEPVIKMSKYTLVLETLAVNVVFVAGSIA